MKNNNVIIAFLNKQKAHTTNLYTKQEDNKIILVNYETPIAYIEGNDLWLNKCKYSPTTSKIQNALERQANLYRYYTILYYNEEKIDKKGGR